METPEGAPLSSFIKVGPKSARVGNIETFDPYLSCDVNMLSLKNIRINDVQPEDITPYIEEIVFDPLYEDGPSTAQGTVGQIAYQRVPE